MNCGELNREKFWDLNKDFSALLISINRFYERTPNFVEIYKWKKYSPIKIKWSKIRNKSHEISDMFQERNEP